MTPKGAGNEDRLGGGDDGNVGDVVAALAAVDSSTGVAAVGIDTDETAGSRDSDPWDIVWNHVRTRRHPNQAR